MLFFKIIIQKYRNCSTCEGDAPVEKENVVRDFASRIEAYRIKHGMTQGRMAEALLVSLSSYKNIIKGLSVTIPAHMAYRAYELTGDFYFNTSENSSPDIDFFMTFKKLPSWRKNIVRTFMSLELEMSEEGESVPEEKKDDCVLYIPTGNMEDGMFYDSSSTMKISVGRYQGICHGQIDCALKITSNSLYPVYSRGDILLIHQQHPRDGDTAVVINRQTKRFYIRRFSQSDTWTLESLNTSGKAITLERHNNEYLNNWIMFGYILMKMR